MTRLPVAPGDRSVPWREIFPPTWHLKPVKYACSINRRALPEMTDPDTEFRYVDISSVGSEGNWSASELMRFADAPSRARRIVTDGDVLVSTVRTYLRAIAHVGKVDEPLICSTGFAVLSANGALDSKFLAYWAQSVYFVDEVVARSVGVSYPAVNASDVGNIPCPLLPLEEQRTIARFLDHETARIDALIRKKSRQIELLHEKRAALISHTVTKGLDPSASMKDSGVEWLGEVPSHWQVKRLKFASTLQTGLTLGKKYADRELLARPYLRVANVQDGYLDLETITEIELPLEEAARYELQPGDVLMTEGGDFDKLGRGYVWEGQIPGCLHQNHIFAVRPDKRVLNPHFLAAVMTSSHGKNYFTSTSQQTTNLATTNSTKLGSFPVPLPPVAEQAVILERVRRDSEHLDRLIGKVNLSIDRLREYRTALISAAVTGRIDVQKEVA